MSFFLERATRLELASRHPANGCCHSQEPWLTSDWIAPPARGGGSEFGGASLSFQKERTRLVVVSFFLERATRLELASRHPANGSPPFAGPLAHLGLDRASGAGWRQRVRRGFSVIPKRKDTTCRRVLLFGAGNEARTRFPPSREWLAAIRRTPGSPRIGSRLRRGVEAASSLGFSVIPKRKDTTCRRVLLFGAGNEARTRYLHLGKVALYQMSYARGTRGILTEKHPLVKPLLQDFLRPRRQRPLHPRPPAADP